MTTEPRTGSPLTRLTRLVNDWHRGALASTVLTEAGMSAIMQHAGLVMVPLTTYPDTLHAEPSGEGHRCARCRRKLQWVHWLNGRPFGSVCIGKENR